MLVCLLKLWESIRENQSQDLKCSFSSLLHSRLTFFRTPTPAVASTFSCHNLPGLCQWAFSYFGCYQKTPHCWFAYLGNVSTFRPLRWLIGSHQSTVFPRLEKRRHLGSNCSYPGKRSGDSGGLEKGGGERESVSGDNLRMGLGVSAERKKRDTTLS